MKKIVSAMLVFVVSLSLGGLAMAAASKPPASFCLNAGSLGVYVLVVKPSSSIKMSDGVQKFYSLQGAIIAIGNHPTMPLIGSGYMAGNVFHFTFNSTYDNSGIPAWVQAEGFWDVITHTGTVHQYVSIGSNITSALSQVLCTGSDIVYDQENGKSPYRP